MPLSTLTGGVLLLNSLFLLICLVMVVTYSIISNIKNTSNFEEVEVANAVLQRSGTLVIL